MDEMFNPVIASQLRDLGHDVVAVQECGLSGFPDRTVFEFAQSERRAVVTENVPDYIGFDWEWRERGEDHSGLVFTSNKTFPRGRPETLGALIGALASLLNDNPVQPLGTIIWLTPDPG